MNVGDYRRFYNFGKVVGRVFLPLRSSGAQNQKLVSLRPRILRQHRSRHLWDSQAWENSSSHLPNHLPCLLPLQIFPQSGVRSLQSPHLRRPASPPCPTSPLPTVSTMSRSLSQKRSRPTMHSTSRTGTLKWYAGRPSFASTAARCHFTLKCSVKCFHLRILLLSSLPTGAHVLCPPIHQPISRLS